MGSPAWHSHLCLEVTIWWFCGLPGCCPVQGQSFSGLGGQGAQRHRLEGAPALMPPMLGQARTLPRAGLLLWKEREEPVGEGQYLLTHPLFRTNRMPREGQHCPVTEQSGQVEFKCRFAWLELDLLTLHAQRPLRLSLVCSSQSTAPFHCLCRPELLLVLWRGPRRSRLRLPRHGRRAWIPSATPPAPAQGDSCCMCSILFPTHGTLHHFCCHWGHRSEVKP